MVQNHDRPVSAQTAASDDRTYLNQKESAVVVVVVASLLPPVILTHWFRLLLQHKLNLYFKKALI